MPNSPYIVSFFDASGMNSCFERLLCDGPQTSEADLKCPEKEGGDVSSRDRTGDLARVKGT